MQDDDIPLLTEVHAAADKYSAKAVPLSADLLAEIISQIRPALEDEIGASIAKKFSIKMHDELMDSLLSESANIQKANQAYLSSALNQQYEQQSAQLVEKFDLIQHTKKEALKQYISDEIARALEDSHRSLTDTINTAILHTQTLLSDKIKHTIDQELDSAIDGAQQAIMENTANFIDKAKADLATELPSMMHANAAILKADLEFALSQIQAQGITEVESRLTQALPAMEQALTAQLQETLASLEALTVENATHALQDKISRLHEDILSEHQTNLSIELGSVYRGLTQQTQTELSVYLEALQLQSQQQLEQKLGDTFPAIYQGLSNELSATLRNDFLLLAESEKTNFVNALEADLPAVELVLANKVQEILQLELPVIEQKMVASVSTEIEKLIDSVRLVFQK